MHYAVKTVPPKRLEEGLLTVKESCLLRQEEALRELPP
jgi:hypothetical protein